jgi:two-component system, chemotaxis family, protein-glutamate methylesterase/glutaminase
VTAIRVLVVDDSTVVRRLLADLIGAEPDMEVVGTAADGRIAMAKLDQVNPDLVTLDVEMPEMNGLQTLAAIRKLRPRLPVIMCSTLTKPAAEATLDALSLGANDYVTKPTGAGSRKEAVGQLRDDLLGKIRFFVRGTLQVALPPAAPRPALVRARPPAVAARIGMVAIGVSTGGPNALQALIPALGLDLPVPVVVVQHMPPTFTRLLAERLCNVRGGRVEEAVDGTVALPGGVYIAPGDFHMIVERNEGKNVLRLAKDPHENSCRPAVDPLFRSVARLFGARSVGVVLTGMGRDGVNGCEHLRETGAQILVQDEATSVVWGMPGLVARQGLADDVLPLGQLGPEIRRRVMEGRTANAFRAATVSPAQGTPK